jgi:hypothetical protein
MALSRSDVLPALKELYGEGEDTDLVMKSHPLLGMTRRNRKMQGRYFHLPIQYGKPQGRSHNITTAGSNEYGSKYAGFDVPPVSDYVVAKVEGLVVRQSMNASNAEMFLNLMKNELDGSLSTLGDNVAKEQYGTFGGARARVHPTTAPSTTSLTLANPEDSFFFEAGMRICAASTDGTSGSLNAAGATVTLVSVNRDTGVLVANANWSTISAIVNDYLFQQGDFGVAASGLGSWVPSSAPGATLFMGVDRSVDPERLGGIRFDGTNETQETVYIKAKARLKRTKANVKYIYTNPINTSNLEVSKEGSKFIDSDNEYKIGYEGFSVNGVKIMEDNDCPVNTAWAIDPSAWFWCTNGDAPSLQDADGVEFLRVGAATGDVFEIQGVIDHNFGSTAPGKLMRISLPTGV